MRVHGTIQMLFAEVGFACLSGINIISYGRCATALWPQPSSRAFRAGAVPGAVNGLRGGSGKPAADGFEDQDGGGLGGVEGFGVAGHGNGHAVAVGQQRAAVGLIAHD